MTGVDSKRKKLLALILTTATTGQIFKATFIKRTTGERRTILARLGVKKGVTGEGLAFDPWKKGLLPVYEMPEGRYRMISVDGLESVTVDGVEARIAER